MAKRNVSQLTQGMTVARQNADVPMFGWINNRDWSQLGLGPSTGSNAAAMQYRYDDQGNIRSLTPDASGMNWTVGDVFMSAPEVQQRLSGTWGGGGPNLLAAPDVWGNSIYSRDEMARGMADAVPGYAPPPPVRMESFGGGAPFAGWGNTADASWSGAFQPSDVNMRGAGLPGVLSGGFAGGQAGAGASVAGVGGGAAGSAPSGVPGGGQGGLYSLSTGQPFDPSQRYAGMFGYDAPANTSTRSQFPEGLYGDILWQQSAAKNSPFSPEVTNLLTSGYGQSGGGMRLNDAMRRDLARIGYDIPQGMEAIRGIDPSKPDWGRDSWQTYVMPKDSFLSSTLGGFAPIASVIGMAAGGGMLNNLLGQGAVGGLGAAGGEGLLGGLGAVPGAGGAGVASGVGGGASFGNYSLSGGGSNVGFTGGSTGFQAPSLANAGGLANVGTATGNSWWMPGAFSGETLAPYLSSVDLLEGVQFPQQGLTGNGRIGLQMPTQPGAPGMGGAQGLTVGVPGGTVGGGGFTAAGWSPSLGDPSSFINGGGGSSFDFGDALKGLKNVKNLFSGGPQMPGGMGGMPGGGDGGGYGMGGGAGGGGYSEPLPDSQFQAPDINPATLPAFGGGSQPSYFSDAPYMQSPFAGTEGLAGAARTGAGNEAVVSQTPGEGPGGATPGSESIYGSPLTAEGLQQRLWRLQGGYPFFGGASDPQTISQRLERLRRAHF